MQTKNQKPKSKPAVFLQTLRGITLALCFSLSTTKSSLLTCLALCAFPWLQTHLLIFLCSLLPTFCLGRLLTAAYLQLGFQPHWRLSTSLHTNASSVRYSSHPNQSQRTNMFVLPLTTRQLVFSDLSIQDINLSDSKGYIQRVILAFKAHGSLKCWLA